MENYRCARTIFEQGGQGQKSQFYH